jgi:glycosyltransferase involved in cell wall biosynthesis
MKLIVQIPAYNEEKTIAQTLRDLPRKIEGITSIETLVIDDGSTDNTAAAARQAGATHVVQLSNHRGLSAAFRAGIDHALRLGAHIIVNTDADNQYQGADVARLVAPIVRGTAEVVIGDRQVASSPHMSPVKRLLQRIGSRTVGLASGLRVADVTSGFRAFSREAAMQINVFNPFTYTLETIIQSGNRNLSVLSVPIRTNAPTRPSRLYRGMGTYLRKSVATIFRTYTMYRPLKTFFFIGSLLMLAGIAIGARFLWFYAEGTRGGHIQSLILAAIFMVCGFQTLLVGLVADLISVNRRLSEDILTRIKRMESPEIAPKAKPAERVERPARNERPERNERPDRGPRRDQNRPAAQPAAQPAAAATAPATQWVWLLDEDKLQDRGNPAPKAEPRERAAEAKERLSSAEPRDRNADARQSHTDSRNGKSATAFAKAEARPPAVDADDDGDEDAGPAPSTSMSPTGPRRRRRRRGGSRQNTDLPGNRGKHLADVE